MTIPSGWSFDCETETATCVSDGISISVFDHVMVQVKADESNHRYRTIFEFLRKSAPAEAAIPYSDSELQNIQQKIFPDGIQADRGV